MRCLPFAMTRGPLLSQILRDAQADGQRYRPCSACGTRLAIRADRQDTVARCPTCATPQPLSQAEEPPWHLSPTAAEALRRTRTWLRRL
jgi:hypothetical protein